MLKCRDCVFYKVVVQYSYYDEDDGYCNLFELYQNGGSKPCEAFIKKGSNIDVKAKLEEYKKIYDWDYYFSYYSFKKKE